MRDRGGTVRRWLIGASVAAAHAALLQGAGVWSRPPAAAPARILVARLLPAEGGAAASGIGLPAPGSGTNLAAAISAAAPVPAARAPRQADEDPGIRFYAQQEVDRPALPASALEVLEVLPLVEEGTPIRLSVYIDRDGGVVRVEIAGAGAANRAAAARLALIVGQARFLPAKLAGTDVATVQALEFRFDPQRADGVTLVRTGGG